MLLAAIPSPSFEELTIGPLSLHLYGVFIALGVLAGVSVARRRWVGWGGRPDDVGSLAVWAVPAGLVGSRIYHVATDFSSRYSDGRWWPDALYVWNGGLGIPGGVLGGTLVGVWWCRRHGVSWRRMADAIAPALPIAQAIGRLGNWFNQELYGRPTDLPWGLRIDDPEGFAPGTTFHPTFLYEGLWNLALAGALIYLTTRIALRPGKWFAVYVVGYGLGRLWVEALRIDDATEVFGVRVNIWISLVAIVGGLAWLLAGGALDRERRTLGPGALQREGAVPAAAVGAVDHDVDEDGIDAAADADADPAADTDADDGGRRPDGGADGRRDVVEG